MSEGEMEPHDVEAKDLDPIILLILRRLLPRVKLLPLIYPTRQSHPGRMRTDRGRTYILATAITSHGEWRHQTDDHLRVAPNLSTLDLGRIEVGWEVFLGGQWSARRKG